LRMRDAMGEKTKRLLAATCSEIAGMGAVGLLFYYLSITDVTRIGNIWAVDRVVAYLLMLAGPLLIFLPASLALRLGPLPVLGAGSWAGLGYVLIFVNAPSPGEAGFFSYGALLSVLFGAM